MKKPPHAALRARTRHNLFFRDWGSPAGQLQLPSNFSKLVLAWLDQSHSTLIDKLRLID